MPLPENAKKLLGDITDKRVYIWAENVLGYLSATKAIKPDWEDFLLDDHTTNKRHYYVHAKDNIPFHSVILPGLLLAENKHQWHLPDYIISSEYLNMNGKKISKSSGNYISARQLIDNFDVDMIGHINMSNSKGTTCQISYGMNYRYKCSLEAWGSIGRLYVDRVFTAPDSLKTHILLDYQDGTKSIDVSEDSSFVKSIENFLQQIKNDGKRDQSYNDLLKQSEIVQHVKDNSIEYGKQ